MFTGIVAGTAEITRIIEKKEIRIPIIILGRNPNEDHQLEWISEEFISELTITDLKA